MDVTQAHLDALADTAEQWHTRLGYPGVVFGIGQGGDILGIRALGYADRERQRPFTSETRVRVASNTKSMTTTLAASLIGDTITTWDTPAHELYPAFRLSTETLTKRATLRDLFSMRLGLAAGDTIVYGQDLTPAELFDIVAALPVEDDPDKRMIYNNELFAVGGLLVAMAAGHTLEQSLGGYHSLLKERIIEPWGLRTAGLGTDLDRFGADFALPYKPDARTWQAHLVGFPGIGAEDPSGGVFASTHDMLTYTLRHLEHYSSSDDSALHACYTDHVPVEGAVHYGLGWCIEHQPGYDVYWHNGGLDGFLSHMAFIPQADAAFFVATNAGTADFFVLGMRMAFQHMIMAEVEPNAVLNRYGEAHLARRDAIGHMLADTPTDEQIDAIIGRYERGVWVERREGDDALLLHMEPRAMHLYPVKGETAFITTGMSDILRIDLIARDKSTRMVVREFGEEQPLPRRRGLRKLT